MNIWMSWHRFFSDIINSSMQPLSTKFHGYLDYATGLILMFSPVIFGFGQGRSESMVPVAAGLIMVFYSFFTDYKLGLYRKLSFPFHLALDILIGIGLIASPWVFDFNEKVYKPHLMMGLIILIISLVYLVSFTLMKDTDKDIRPMDKVQFN